MARIDLPPNTRRKTLADGRIAFYWEAPRALRRDGLGGMQSEALGGEAAIAIARAAALNEQAAAIQSGTQTYSPGTIGWLVQWYEHSKPFKKLRSADWTSAMIAVFTEYELVAGRPMKTLQSRAVTPDHVDTIYEALFEDRPTTANGAMKCCRAMWNRAIRRGRSRPNAERWPETNPFAEMDLESVRTNTRPASREETYAYAEKAEAMGHRGLGLAAVLAFEFIQRQGDTIGTIAWANYDGARIYVRQEKTGAMVWLPLYDEEGECLFAEAVAWIEATPRRGTLIVMRERKPPGNAKRERKSVWLPYNRHLLAKHHRAVANACGLPDDFQFRGFRHGGATELGDAGGTDQELMAMGGWQRRETVSIYSKRSNPQAVNAAKKRRAWTQARRKVGMKSE